MAWTNILPLAVEKKSSYVKLQARFSLIYLDNFFSAAGLRIYNVVSTDTLDFEASEIISPAGGLQFQKTAAGVNNFGTPVAELTRISFDLATFDMIFVLSGPPYFSDFANLQLQADI